MTEKIISVDLMRHGEPVGGTQFRGSKDDPLSELGWEQMNQSIELVSGWNQIITSPLLRCKEFAHSVSNKIELSAPLSIHNDLQEIHFGDWEGLTAPEVDQRYPGAVEKFWTRPTSYEVPNGETIKKFQTRILQCWNQIIESTDTSHLLLVCHGGTIRIILAEVLGIPLDNMWRIQVPYASISRVNIFIKEEKSSSSLIFHNIASDH